MAKRCIELDSSVPDFHHLWACMLVFVGDHKNGLRAVDRAIELLPNHTDWLYTRATLMRLAELSNDENSYSADAAELYLEFVSSNPPDHHKFPEAFYCLTLIYLLSHEKTEAQKYDQKALEAEDPKIRLPCFEPVKDDFPPKLLAARLLKVD